MTLFTTTKSFTASIFGSPERDRLAGAIAETRVELDDHCADKTAKKGWEATADEFLKQSEDYLNDWNLQQGWVSLAAAQRAMLANPNDSDRLIRVAIILRREADKVTGWRAKAIEDLLSGIKDADGKTDGNAGDKAPVSAAPEPVKEPALSPEKCKRVIDAVALRDDQANTTYFKILLRRQSLFKLFLLLWAGIFVCAGLVAFHALPAPFNAVRQVAAVMLFGVLGAVLSVAQGLLTSDISAKIPSQQIGSFVVWMRPGIGVVAALIAFALIHANKTLNIFASTWTSDFNVIAVLAFAAGFSERFIVGAIERISQVKNKGD